MAEYKATTFNATRIELDGNAYKDCMFSACEIVYGARGTVNLDGCTFDRCTYVLDGAAQDTLMFLTALYKIDPRSIEATFENIRSGAQPMKPPPPPQHRR